MTRRRRNGVSSKPSATAGKCSQPKATQARRNYHGSVEGSPVKDTAKERPPELPRKLLKLVGLRRCVVGCMIGPPWLVQGIHIVSRTLKNSHADIYHRFRNCVGILDEKTGEKVIDLDGTGNYEWVHFDMHHLFDGRSVQGSAYGGGEWAFCPKNLRAFVAHMKANPGADYKTLCPSGLYEFIIYGFPSGQQHLFGRYSDDQRTYAHLNKDGKAWTKDEILQWYMDSQHRHGPVEARILQVGDQGFVIISHMNPVFVVFDYALKMKYRVIDRSNEPDLIKGIPQEDIDFFKDELWPVVQCWFEAPSPNLTLALKKQVARPTGLGGAVRSEGAVKVAPVTPPVRTFRSAPEKVPVTRDSPPPAFLVPESAKVAEVKQHVLFGGPSTDRSEVRYRYASSDAGASDATQSQYDDTESLDDGSSSSTSTAIPGSGLVSAFPDDYDYDVDPEYGADECDPKYDDCDYVDDGQPNAEPDDDVQEHGLAPPDDDEDDLDYQRTKSESPCPARPMYADDPSTDDDSDGESTATVRDERDTDTFADASATDQEPPPSGEPPAIPSALSAAPSTSTAHPVPSTSVLKKPAASKKSKKIVHFSGEDEENPGELEEHSDGIKNQSLPSSTSASSSTSDPTSSSAMTTTGTPPIGPHPATTSEPPPDDSPPKPRRSTRAKQPPKPPGTVHAPPPNAPSLADRPKRTGKANKAASARASASASASSSSGQGPGQPRPPAKPRGQKRTRDDRDADDDQDDRDIDDQFEDDEDADESDDVESVHSEYLPRAKRAKKTKAPTQGKGKPHK
ncbi:uncharacterized protein SCHCODRAFT_02695906 [Schizophyllum commune H4-8]|uniref:Uncharacterized protein n=1 Tax=Schizophyllum commune (strain H4-8 / FGSC 9210) TaxID=578458 RepID=D8PUB6_SCHCM|nr:uncharacterized protein SCHCODRAFT_02695906 [Schizophyllum commune H4-8]KAI5900742.1 hypothetical protein SCHCODRAFT_02695906 [Schizophyllum commune H4-8]